MLGRSLSRRKGARERHLTEGGAWVAVAVLLVGCAGRRPPSSPSARSVELAPVIVRPYDEVSPEAKFEQARAALERGEARRSADLFDEVSRDPGAGSFGGPALYDAGLAWEQAGERGLALDRFQRALRLFPSGEEGKLAGLRISRLLARDERWAELRDVSSGVLERRDLRDVERLEALGASALAEVELGAWARAEPLLAKGHALVADLGLGGGGGRLPFEVAQIDFAEGELRKAKSEAIALTLSKDFPSKLEARCQLLLDAQNAYAEAMRSYDPHVAALSGLRVGELYRRLYRDLLAVPPPRLADTAAKQRLFEAAVRLRYRVLLSKGRKMLDHTIHYAEVMGESDALERASRARDELEEALREQDAALKGLPFSESDLERALRDLAHRKGGEL